MTLGDAKHEPRVEEAVELLRHAKENVVVNLLGVQLEERPRYFIRLFSQICQLRAVARPHWVLIDEAHHMMPPEWPASASLPQQLHGTILVTVHPDHVARAVLQTVAFVLVVGSAPATTLRSFCGALGEAPPELSDGETEPGIAYFLDRRERRLRRVRVHGPQQQMRRHTRKYVEGELGEDRSFYFRGPDGRLNLRAQNLMVFLQIAEGGTDERRLALHHFWHGGLLGRWVGVSE